MTKCKLCGKPMNPAQVMLAGGDGPCMACVKKLHASVLRPARKNA
jgi:hypothetical protein